jgi:hypothetical protein
MYCVIVDMTYMIATKGCPLSMESLTTWNARVAKNGKSMNSVVGEACAAHRYLLQAHVLSRENQMTRVSSSSPVAKFEPQLLIALSV